MRTPGFGMYTHAQVGTFAARSRRWLHSLGGDRGRGHEARIARETGLKQDGLNKILSKKHNLTLSKLETIARYRGCKLSDLVLEIDANGADQATGRVIPFQRSVRLWNRLIAENPDVAKDGLELFEKMMELKMTAAINAVSVCVLRDGPKHAIPRVVEILLLEAEQCKPQRRRLRTRILNKYEPDHQGAACPEQKYRHRR